MERFLFLSLHYLELDVKTGFQFLTNLNKISSYFKVQGTEKTITSEH
jgi:hypothetical protein